MEEYGSDFITITDDEGTEYELEVLSTVEYNGQSYLAVVMADDDEEDDMEVYLLKSTEDEDGEPILSILEDPAEAEAVYALVMEQIYDDEE